MDTQEILQQCAVENNLVKLPNIQLDRKSYTDVAKQLEAIGGKWNRKAAGFIFPENPSELLAQIANGESRNLKKEYQFFATPAKLADKLVELADVEAHHSVLEPSAGQGAIVDAVGRKFPDMRVYCCEAMPTNRSILLRHEKTFLIGADFLQLDTLLKYDRIIANPPFSKNQDIDHVYKMFECLKTGGRIVAITSKHWQMSSNKKERAFAEWVEENAVSVEEIEQGEFKESGTTVGGFILVIDKK